MLDYYYSNTDYVINYGHTTTLNPGNIDFHLHNRFEIYYFISGNVNYFIEKKAYRLKYGDLLIINSHEVHKPSFSSGEPYERVVIHFDPSIPRIFNPYGSNLLECFTNRPCGENNRISLSQVQSQDIMEHFKGIESLNPYDCNSKVLKLTRFIELLVYVNHLFSNTNHVDEHLNVPDKLTPVFEHIDNNLEKDLSLETLEQRFYINRFHLCRLFKRSTGRSLHEYIVLKRISRAKRLLSEGKGVTEACNMSGFNDYSNFLRMFKRTVGKTPGQYRKAMSKVE